MTDFTEHSQVPGKRSHLHGRERSGYRSEALLRLGITIVNVPRAGWPAGVQGAGGRGKQESHTPWRGSSAQLAGGRQAEI